MNKEEQARPAVLSDVMVKFVFDHFRNILISASVFTAGGAVFRFREQLVFGSTFNTVFAGLLVVIGFGLVMLNFMHGVMVVSECHRMAKRWQLAVFAMASSAFLALAFASITATVLFNLGAAGR